MPRSYRQQYTRPIPPDAVRVTHKGEPAVRFKLKGKPIVAPLTAKGDRCRVESPMWYGRYVDENGEEQRVPLSENKTAAQTMLNELVRKAEMAKAGIRNPFEKHATRPLAEHLDEFEASLIAKGSSQQHASQTTNRVRKVVEGCNVVFYSDLSASAVQSFLADLRQTQKGDGELPTEQEEFTPRELIEVLGCNPQTLSRTVKRFKLEASGAGKRRRFPRSTAELLINHFRQDVGTQTSNYYLQATKQFCRWMVKDRRAGENLLAHLQGSNDAIDRRHDRRALTT